MIKITSREQFNQFKQDFEGKSLKSVGEIPEGFKVELNTGEIYQMPKNCKKWLESQDQYSNDLIFGSDKTKNVVSCEIKGNSVHIFTEDSEGVKEEIRPFKYWIMSNAMPSGIYTKMAGNLHYKYLKEFGDEKDYKKAMQHLWKSKADKYVCYDAREAYMVRHGLTYFKGMKVQDVSILSFDIETTGLKAENSETLLISNTFRRNGEIIRKLFDISNYKNELCMIYDWCNWVREMNPSIMLGHNVYSFDFQFLHDRVKILEKSKIPFDDGYYGGLKLGRDDSNLEISKNVSQYRYDGSQSYDYHKMNIFGREIVDTFFLSMKYDALRNFTSYGLKNLIKELGLEKEGRIIWDFEKDPVKDLWKINPEKWADFCEYCIDDGDDSLKLFDIMSPSYFYTNVSIPKTFQTLLLSATGAWINTFLIRGYLAEDHSIPKPNERKAVHGGISFGVPGVYKNILKVDVASEYPSAIREYKIYPEKKDPKQLFLKMVNYFTDKRFEQKAKYKETGDTYYDDLQAASKIYINSAYGVLGTSGLHFNDFDAANMVTGIGRQVIRKSLLWASGNDVDTYMEDYELTKDLKYNKLLAPDLKPAYDFTIGPCDTDSISFCKKDMSEFSPEEIEKLISEMNDFLPEKIVMEDDGLYKSVVIVKAKNYILDNGKKVKFKGSSLTDAKKEPALREMMEKVGHSLLNGVNYDELQKIYLTYVREACNVTDIKRWAVKKTVSKPVLESATNPEARANERKVWDAIKHLEPQEGNKVYVYDSIDGEIQKVVKGEPVFLRDGSPKMIPNMILKTIDQYKNDTVPEKLVKRVFATMKIFETVVDIEKFPNYSLSKYRSFLGGLIDHELIMEAVNK